MFTITNLPPGNYELKVEKPGFRTYRQTAIVLETGQTLRRDIRMDVGAVTETISVTAEVAQLNTENGMIKGDVIVHQEIQDMPLNGRDFTELALLVPGVVTKAQGGSGSFASVNGARSDNTNFRVDGFDDRNIRGAAAQLRPNIDALQEFKMEVSGYSAEYGKMAGGILNMTLRSGTNQFHGALFEYFRNSIFDARAYFDTKKLSFHQNQWGGTLAGPLVIPKLYNGRDRTFFMISEESYRLSWFESNLGTVPTALERAGDFSKTVNAAGAPTTLKNPYASNAPFPGNVIPASLISPIALKLLTYYPLPNRTAPGNNHISVANNRDNWDSVIGRLDHRFSEKDTLSFRYGKRWGRSNAPWAASNLGTFDKYVRDDRVLGGLTYTHMFTPALLTEGRVGVSRNSSREHNLSDGIATAADLGMQGSSADPMLAGFPLINVTNYLSLGFAANEPVQYFVTDWQFGDTFTWIKAKHVLKWGFTYDRYQFNQPYFNNSRGTMTANGNWTGNGTAANGNAIGDLLLGLLNSSSITTQINRNYMREESTSLFFNDDWKWTRSLTLNFGLRYELNTPPYDKYNRMSNFIPDLGKIVISSSNGVANYNDLLTNTGLTNTMALAKDAGLSRSLVHTFNKGFAPRVGFAWRPLDSHSTVLRGGYGIFYAGQLLNNVRNALDNTFPFVLANTCNRVASDPAALTLANPWNPARCSLSGTTSAAGFDIGPVMGYIQSYNLTVERNLGKGSVVEVGFVGSKGTHLSRQYNLNLPFRTIASYQATGTFASPFPQLGTINYWDLQVNSIYNAGQIILRRRSANGIFYRIGYQYSKSIDTASQEQGASDGGFAQALDPRNLRLERARSDWDRGHTFTANFAWQLPFGRGKRLLGSGGRVQNAIAAGWQLSGTATFYTGAPFTVQDSSVNAAIGESTRPNRITSGKDITGDGRKGVDYRWFDATAFVHVPACASRTNCSSDAYGFLPFAPGNSGRAILDGPGTQNINLSMFKSIPVGERKRAQFRWEVFNICNHPNFQLPNRNYNETAGGYLNDVQSKGQGGPRIMQFALRYEF
jgi:hypothetical protein